MAMLCISLFLLHDPENWQMSVSVLRRREWHRGWRIGLQRGRRRWRRG